MHPRPSPIAASLYTLRDMNVEVIVMHGPTGCCFRTARLLESDGVWISLKSGMRKSLNLELFIITLIFLREKMLTTWISSRNTLHWA